MSDELRYGIIRYIRKEKTFNIIDRNRTIIYDSRVGFLDFKSHSINDKFKSEEIDKFIVYLKPLMNKATDRNTINTNSYQFYFNKLLISK